MSGSSGSLIQPLIDDLHRTGRVRVWSLVITIFGDAIQLRGGTVATADLLAITSTAGIEPGGLRTAMSRLQKEGWVESWKKGRNSYYRLSGKGVEAFVPATQLIYSRPGDLKDAETLTLIITPGEERLGSGADDFLSSHGAIAVVDGVYLWTAKRDPDPDLLNRFQCIKCVTSDNSLPDWLKRRVFSDKLSAQYKSLASTLSELLDRMNESAKIDPLIALTGRILLIHQWRKLVLKTPQLPQILFPVDWPGPACAEKAGKVYHSLLDPSEAYWNEPTDHSQQSLLQNRFR